MQGRRPGASAAGGARPLFPGPEAWGAGAAAAAILLFLTAKAPGSDEGKTLVLAGLPWGAVLPFVSANEPGPPGYFLLARAWSALFADPLFGLRLLSASCVLGALAVFRVLARRLAPSAPEGAFLLACASSFWLFAAQDARCYGALLLLGVLQTVLVLALAEPGGWCRRRLAAYALTCAAGAFAHYFGAVLVLLHGLHLMWRLRGERARLAAAAAFHAGLAGLLSCWAAGRLGAQVDLAASGFVDRAGPGPLLRVVGTMLWEPGFLGFLGGWVPVALGGAFTLTAAAGLARPPAGASASARRVCAGYLAAGLAVVAALDLALGRPFVQARYFIGWSPFLFCLLAEGAAGLRGPWRPAAWTALAAVAAVGSSGYLASVAVFDPDLGRWAQTLRRADDGRRPVVYLESYYFHAMREHYLPERPQYLAAGAAPRDFRWETLPRYRALADAGFLDRPGGCLAVDPRRELGGPMLSGLPCRELARRLPGAPTR